LFLAVPLRAPELEAASRGVEIGGQVGPESCDLVTELEQLEVDQTLGVAEVLVLS
jgi:hypothetical protein